MQNLGNRLFINLKEFISDPIQIISVIASVLFLVFAIITMLKRKKSIKEIVYVLLSTSVFSILLFSIGSFTQEIFWTGYNKGLSGIWPKFEDIFEFTPLFINLIGYPLFPGIATAAISNTGNNTYQKIKRAILTAIFSMSGIDVLSYIFRPEWSLSYTAFSILCNIIGCSVIGLLIGIMASRISLESNRGRSIVNFKIDTSKIIILCFSCIFFALGIFFIFFYQNPSWVSLRLSNWGMVSFYYDNNDPKNKYIEIPLRTKLMVSIDDGKDLEFDLNFLKIQNHNESIPLFLFTTDKKMTQILNFGDMDDLINYVELINKAEFKKLGKFYKSIDYRKFIKNFHQKRISEGKIFIAGNYSMKRIFQDFYPFEGGKEKSISSTKSFNAILSVPINKKIIVNKNSNDFILFPKIPFFNNNKDRSHDHKQVSIKGWDKECRFKLNVLNKSPLLIQFQNNILNYSRNQIRLFSVRLPKIKDPINFYSTTDVDDNMNLQMVIGQTNNAKFLSFPPNIKYIETSSCDLNFQGIGRSHTFVGDFFVKDPKGLLYFPTGKKIDLNSNGYLLLKGKNLEIIDIPEQEIRIEGTSNRVELNGNILTSPFFSSIHNKIGIISLILTIVMLLFGNGILKKFSRNN